MSVLLKAHLYLRINSMLKKHEVSFFPVLKDLFSWETFLANRLSNRSLLPFPSLQINLALLNSNPYSSRDVLDRGVANCLLKFFSKVWYLEALRFNGWRILPL